MSVCESFSYYVCLYIYMHIYIYIYNDKHTINNAEYIHRPLSLFISCSSLYMFVCVYIYGDRQMDICVYVIIESRSERVTPSFNDRVTRSPRHTHTHTNIYPHIHTHTHIYIYIYIYIYMKQ